VFVGGVRLGVWGVVLVVCVCVSVSGVLFSVGVCVWPVSRVRVNPNSNPSPAGGASIQNKPD